MKRWLIACLAWLLLGPAATAGKSPPGEGWLRLQRDLTRIIIRLLSCHDRTREPRYLEMAMHVGEIRTHPFFELEWGRRPRNAALERKLLLRSAALLDRLGGNACPPGECQRDLCRLAREYVRADRTVPREGGNAAPGLTESCHIASIQKRLSGTQLLLKYILLEDRVLLFHVGAEQAGYEFLPVGRDQAVAMIDRLSEPLEDFANGRVDYLRIHFDMELAQRLYNVFLRGTAERFPQADELFIIPDGELYKLPFEALVTGFSRHVQQDDALFSEYQAAEYVIQNFKVSYYFSFADFLRDFSGPREYPYSLAAFGHPLVPAPGRTGAGRLPRGTSTVADIPTSRLEVLDLKKLFDGSRSRIFLGADFNQDSFSRFAPQAQLVHLATHFFNDADDPSRSAFLLSAVAGQPALCDAKMIQDLNLRAQLVILSACESSEKNLMGFKQLSGMTAAMRRSGVRDLIASLWPVDEFSSQVVPLFYREFLRSGDSATALRHAKLLLFGRTIPIQDGVRLSLAHPFLWANYVLYRFYR